MINWKLYLHCNHSRQCASYKHLTDGLDLLSMGQSESSVQVISLHIYSIPQTSYTASMLTTAELCVTAAVISLQYHQPSLFANVTITASRVLVEQGIPNGLLALFLHWFHGACALTVSTSFQPNGIRQLLLSLSTGTENNNKILFAYLG